MQVEMYKTGQTPRRAAVKPPRDVVRAVELSRSTTATPLHLPVHHSRSSSRRRGWEGSELPTSSKFSPRSTMEEAEKRLMDMAQDEQRGHSGYSGSNSKQTLSKPVQIAAFPSAGAGRGQGDVRSLLSSPPPPPNVAATPPSAYMSLNRKYIDVFSNPDVLK